MVDLSKLQVGKWYLHNLRADDAQILFVPFDSMEAAMEYRKQHPEYKRMLLAEVQLDKETGIKILNGSSWIYKIF